MTKAEDFEAETKSRGEELAALAKAKEIIVEATSLLQEPSVSLLQVSAHLTSSAGLAQFEAARLVRDLAQKHKSTALAQLAARISSLSHSNSKDIFGKVKGLIRDMINKLETEAEADATEKGFCDKELAETNAKKDEKTTKIEKLRSEEAAAFAANSAELEKGLTGIKTALKVLNEYYAKEDKAHASADGAGGG